jgi:hypothetical protein
MSTLRAGENCLFFPAETPDIDLSPLNELQPRAGEFWCVLDPPRHKTAGGVMLRVDGDGWSNPGIETEEKLWEHWQESCKRAAEAIAIYRMDKRSFRAKTRAHMLAEIAMQAYEKLMAAQMASDAESPGAGMENRSDAYTVARVGEGVPLTPGDRVILAPYAARRLKELNGVKDVCLVGLDDPWQDVTILLLNPITGEFEPMDNWIGVQIAEREFTVASSKKSYHNFGTVKFTGPNAESKRGQVVALHKDRTVKRPDDTKWFGVKWSPYDGQRILYVREVDSSGFRRVLGVIE